MTAPEDFDRQKWAHEIGRRDAERAHDRHDESWTSHNKAAVEAANVAIRSSILVNGGAAISVLTFVGSLAAQGRVATNQVNDVASSLLWFAGGVAAALTTAALAYIVNLLNADQLSTRKKVWNHPWVEETPLSRRLNKLRISLQIFATLIGLVSIVFFVIGIFDVKYSITRFGAMSAAQPTQQSKHSQ